MRDNDTILQPRNFILPRLENLGGTAGMISGMLFLSGSKIMFVSGARYIPLQVE